MPHHFQFRAKSRYRAWASRPPHPSTIYAIITFNNTASCHRNGGIYNTQSYYTILYYIIKGLNIFIIRRAPSIRFAITRI